MLEIYKEWLKAANDDLILLDDIIDTENYGKENLAIITIKNEIKNLHRKNNKNP